MMHTVFLSLPQGPLMNWLKVNFSQVFASWLHLKALRVFAESVLRLAFVSFPFYFIEAFSNSFCTFSIRFVCYLFSKTGISNVHFCCTETYYEICY